MPEFKLPDVGEGLTEAEIVTWHVAVGETVTVNQVIVDIETAKSIVELPSPYSGEVTAILVEEGETVAVGTPIITIGDPSESAAEDPGPSSGERETSESSSKTEVIDTNIPLEGNPTLVGYGPRETKLERRARAGAAPAVETSEPDGVLAKPPVRKLANDLGVDLTTVAPSGEGGVITREDVEAASSAGTPMPGVYREGEETREPIKGVRKMMAAAMVESAFTAPHVTEWVTVDATATTEFVARLQQRREFADLKVSPLLVVARAVALAVGRTPIINSFWNEAAQEVVVKPWVNLGIAAATPRGLIVPNIKAADRMSLAELADAIGELTATARAGRTQPADQAGGTLTITNVGVFGVDGGTPIINPGESAILCMGQIARRPWVVEDEVVPRDVMTLSLSFDHRHVDGAAGSQFLADVAGIVTDPATAMLF
jgi:pyruvate dehydrogenase E2 component (dihydrolipoamide acetyltransferase)